MGWHRFTLDGFYHDLFYATFRGGDIARLIDDYSDRDGIDLRSDMFMGFVSRRGRSGSLAERGTPQVRGRAKPSVIFSPNRSAFPGCMS